MPDNPKNAALPVILITALFFFFVDQIISLGVRALFGVGG